MSLPDEEKAIAKGLIAELEASENLGCSRESGPGPTHDIRRLNFGGLTG